MKSKGLLLLLLVGLGIFSPLSAAQSPVNEEGPYQVGIRALLLNDESRDNRPLQAFVWYPAVVAKDARPPYPPDTAGGKYPLIIYSHGYGTASSEASGNFKRWVSQGFVVAAVDHHDPAVKDKWLSFINRPLDILFLLDQVAELNDSDLSGIIDMDNVGILGGSMGGYTAFAAAGAQVDPAHFPAWCPTYVDDPNYKLNFDGCSLLSSWDTLLSLHKQYNPPSTDDLWAATADERIKAIMVIAPCFAQMFGEKGLESLTVPTLIVGGTLDHTCPYDIDSTYYYQNIASEDRYLLALKDRDHSGAFSIPGLDTYYASAFFGLYLQGKTDYARYLTPDSADAYKDVTLESQLGEK